MAHGAEPGADGRPLHSQLAGMARLQHDVVTLPADQQALGLVEAILEQTAFDIPGDITITWSNLAARLGTIQGTAGRLKVLLEKSEAPERHTSMDTAMHEIAFLRHQLTMTVTARSTLLEALKGWLRADDAVRQG